MAGDGRDPPFMLEYWNRLGGEKDLNDFTLKRSCGEMEDVLP